MKGQLVTMDNKYVSPLHDGTEFFRHRYPTIRLEHEIERMNSFEDFERFYTDELIGDNRLMAEYLYYLIDRYGSNPNKTALSIGKSHSYVRKICSGEKIDPSRDVLLAICVYLQATVEETQILLKYAGKQPLYARRRRDAIIWYALKKHLNLHALNIYLDEKGYDSLCRIIERSPKEQNEE